MRKISNMFMLVAAAAMTFVSCQKEENRAPETVSATLTMHAGVDQTKTYLDENNAVLWGKGEAVKLYVGAGENEKFVSSTPTDAYDGAAIASFEISITELDAAESYNLGGIYPASATVDNKNPETYKVVLSDVQNAEVGKYDPSAYIMVLKPETVETLPTEYQASFRRATALNKITLTGVKEDISSVEITVPEGKDFAGRRYFNLMDGTSGDIYYGQSNTITVNAPFTGSEIDVWFCSWGVELAAGDKLTVKLTATENENTYTHTITAREQGIVFAEGDLNKLAINMANVNADEQEQPEQPDGAAYYEKVTSAPTDWSGQYLIVYEDNATAYVFNGKDEVNGYVSATINNNKIAATSEIDAVAVTIEPMSGGYAIKTSAGYIYGKSGSNALEFDESQKLNEIAYSLEDNDVTITSGRVLRFNNASNQMRYRYYSAGTQKPIQLYRLEEGNTEPEQPKVLSSIAVSEEKKIEYYVGEDFEAPTVTATYEGGKTATVTATFTGYDLSDEGTQTVTVSYTENEVTKTTTYEITVSAVPAIEELTIEEFLAAETSDAVYYQLTGIITNIASSDWGNITIKDASASVYIYGLTKEKKTSNDKSFSSLGLKVGDQVTLITVRGEHNGTAQGGGTNTPAYYVSHIPSCVAPTISCADNKVTITAEAGATVYYTTNGTTPTESSTKYTTPFDITSTVTVKAIAVATGKMQSSVAEQSCAWVDPNAGSGDEPAEDIILTVDWATNVGSLNTSGLTNSFTIGGYSYTASGASCYYYASGKACFLGKSGAYVQVPQIAGYKLTNVTLKSSSTTGGASVTIKTTSNAAATGTTATFANGQSKEFSFDITNPQVNTSYRITVTNAKNAHIAKWVLTYEPAN